MVLYRIMKVQVSSSKRMPWPSLPISNLLLARTLGTERVAALSHDTQHNLTAKPEPYQVINPKTKREGPAIAMDGDVPLSEACCGFVSEVRSLS